MSISERTLRKWRKEALISLTKFSNPEHEVAKTTGDLNRKILQMTQILLDQHLLNKGK